MVTKIISSIMIGGWLNQSAMVLHDWLGPPKVLKWCHYLPCSLAITFCPFSKSRCQVHEHFLSAKDLNPILFEIPLMRPLLNVNFSGTGLPQSPLWWARLMPWWRWWSWWWSTWPTWSWSCWWGGGWEWMPGRNLSGGESHFSSFFFVAHFSWTKLDFCHRPPLSNVKGKVMQACFL